jgi:PRD1 phage membrane DNA delivery
MSQITEAMVSIGALVVGLAILATLVSGRAKTVDVINSLSAGFANSLSAATAPVTGSSTAPVVTPGGGFGLPSFSNLLPG